jgi:hypothetical protein
MFDLDFSILPTIVRHSVFQGLPHFVEDPLSKLQLPETLDRLKSASWLLDEVSASMKEWQNRGFLRAGLSEFRSVAQALHWDLGRREVYAPEKSRNPLVHLVVRLRRVAVYLANAPTATQSVIAAITFGEQSTESEIEILLIADLERFLRADNLGGYRDEDISRVCSWFDENQRIYGAPQVLSVGVGVYGLELCREYADRHSPEPA